MPAPYTHASQLAHHSGGFLHRALHAARSHAVAHRDQRQDAATQRSHEAVHCLRAKHEGTYVVLCADALVGNFPAATVGAAPAWSTLPALSAGDTAIFGADGRVISISYVKADGSTVLWGQSGKPSTTVDATGNLVAGATSL